MKSDLVDQVSRSPKLRLQVHQPLSIDVDNLLQETACRGCQLRMPKIPDDEGAQKVIAARELWLVDEHPSEELQSHGRFCVL